MTVRHWMLIAAVLFLLSWRAHVSSTGQANAEWLNFHADPQHTGRSGEAGVESPSIKWRFDKVPLMNDNSPVVGPDGTVYVLKGRGYGGEAVYALNPDGTERWNFDVPGINFTQPALSGDGALYTLATRRSGKEAEGGLLFSIDASGELNWERELSPYAADLWTPHVVVDSKGSVYAGAADLLYAMNPDGTKRWSYKFVIGKKAGSPEYSTGPTLSPDEKTAYYFKRMGGGVMAFDAATGRVKWHDRTPYSADMSVLTVGPDGTIYVPDADGPALHALNPDGSRKWKAEFPDKKLYNTNATIGTDGTVYVDLEKGPTGAGGWIYALSPEDGSTKWVYKFERGALSSPMAIDSEGNIYTGTGDGYLVCLSPEGRLLWKVLVGFEVPEEYDRRKAGAGFVQIHMTGPVISDGTVYIQVGTYTDGNSLVAVGRE
ncbi:MAG: PQQ-binding-like beta-propeller repeat protein [Thermodesulfobacteriota bacterium]